MDDIHRKILRKFHTLCAVAGLSEDEKMALVIGYGVESSADIDTHDLIDLCNKLARRVEPKTGELDRLRKQAMAAIGGWLKVAGRDSNIEIIKAIACRATEHSSFNKIPPERLRNLYYTFSNKQKDKASVDSIIAELVDDDASNRRAGTTVYMISPGTAGSKYLN